MTKGTDTNKYLATSDKTDPTTNVTTLVIAAVERLDDLRDAECIRINERFNSFEKHSEELRIAEAKRLDAIRATDVGAVQVANERSVQQASILANQVSASAEMLRTLVATTATAQAAQLNQLTSQMIDRISSLEKAQYEQRGNSGGMRDMYGWIAAGIMMLVNIASIAYMIFKK
jgi:hypothetical protein